jgi:DNA (cytosine-5)-methyltransferase 1
MKVVSLFSGCGGLDLGLLKAGHKIVYASDIDRDSCETYTKNFGHTCVCEDVKDLNTDNLPIYDLLVGGFPCQGFSIANQFRHEKDERNELYLQIVRILEDTRPKFFLAENVQGILSLGNGSIVKMIEEEFSNVGINNNGNGYEVKKYLLNAADYGVPQNRKRVIFLGISKDFKQEVRDLMFSKFPPQQTHSDSKSKLLNPKTLKDAIGDLPEPYTKLAENIANHITTNHAVKLNGYMGNRVLDWNKPSPTIVGRGGGTGGPVIAVHPNLNRRFSVRETARIQTFPDNFIFYGSASSQYRQIGNAVAVEFAYSLGLALKKIEKLGRANELANSDTLLMAQVD